MKILNLYACLGGNRYKWGNEHEITSVENDPFLIDLYRQRFPNDRLIFGDAHQYLLDHYSEFDFIWSSPPCPTHSRPRFWGGKAIPKYPDMRLYQEIIFLTHYFKGFFCVENVVSYYEPLITPQKRGRHYFWTNFLLPANLNEREFKDTRSKNELKRLCEFHDFDFYQYKGDQKTLSIGRNLIDYEVGKTILDIATKGTHEIKTNQLQLTL
jgi:DNA (cytosine-5)-methyltransferase 1